MKKQKRGQKQETSSSEGKQRASTSTQDIEMETSSGDSESGMPSVNTRRPRRARQLPARFRTHSDTESDNDDGIVCGLCNAREPINCRADIVFWVDCSDCGKWFHTYCAFGDNTRTHQYFCESCL